MKIQILAGSSSRIIIQITKTAIQSIKKKTENIPNLPGYFISRERAGRMHDTPCDDYGYIQPKATGTQSPKRSATQAGMPAICANISIVSSKLKYRDGSVLLNLLRPPSDALRGVLNYLTGDESGDGTEGPRGAGWLTVNQADPLLLLDDVGGRVLKIVQAAFETAWDHGLRPMPGLNPNDPSCGKPQSRRY